MFKAKNPDVIDVEKYTPIKKPDSAFKIEKDGNHDVLVLDSDDENIENNVKLPSCRNLEKEFISSIPSTSSSVPTILPSHNKKYRQQTLTDAFKPKKITITQLEKPAMSQPSTSQKSNAEKWEEVKKRLRSPSFKKTVIKNAIMAYAANGPKKRGRALQRCQTPENTHIISSNPYFAEEIKAKENAKAKAPVSQYGYPLTPPRYWDINFPTIEEQQERGMIKQSDSPLFKKNKK